MEHVNRSFSHFFEAIRCSRYWYCLFDDSQLTNRSCCWVFCVSVCTNFTDNNNIKTITLPIQTFPNRSTVKFGWNFLAMFQSDKTSFLSFLGISRLFQSQNVDHCNGWSDCAHTLGLSSTFCFIKNALNFQLDPTSHTLLWTFKLCSMKNRYFAFLWSARKNINNNSSGNNNKMKQFCWQQIKLDTF